MRTHGLARTAEHRSWSSMLNRCQNCKTPAYAWYGAKGITVCDRWKQDFSAFLSDMGPKPSPLHTLDRIDGNGNYTPVNCRWATRKEQSRNRACASRRLILDGIALPVWRWAELKGMNYRTLYYRIFSYNWTVREALTTAVRDWGRI